MVLTVSILCIVLCVHFSKLYLALCISMLNPLFISTFLMCHEPIWQDIILGPLGYTSHNPYHPHEVQGIIYYGRLHMQWFWFRWSSEPLLVVNILVFILASVFSQSFIFYFHLLFNAFVMFLQFLVYVLYLLSPFTGLYLEGMGGHQLLSIIHLPVRALTTIKIL